MTDIIVDAPLHMLGKAGSKWSIAAHCGVRIIHTVEGAAIRLAITNTSGANWHGALCYAPFAVEAGEILTVSFAARAELPFTFSVWLGQQNPPCESLVPQENHFGEKMMTAQWQTFVHTWKPECSEEAARLNLVLGQIDNTVEIENVRLEQNG